MTADRIDLPQGTLELLILRTLALEPQHGWAISERIRQVSSDVLQVRQGSLYPALHRLERRGWITASWGTSEHNRQAKFYALTPAGRRQLESDVDAIKDDCRQAWGLRLVDDVAQDLRFGARGLWRNPGFAVGSLFIVAFGVAAATAIFSVANATFVRPLPYPEADRLVAVTRFQRAGGGYGISHDRDTSAFLADYATSFSSLAATRSSPGPD